MTYINHPQKSRVNEIRDEIEKEEQEIYQIRELVSHMKEQIIDKDPSHFSTQDIFKIFFGSLTVGFAFIFSSALVKTALNLELVHIEIIIILTFLLLALEIFFVWSKRVKDKQNRTLSEFLTKRLTTLYVVAVISSFLLIYTFNIDNQLGSIDEVIKLVIMMTMPCSLGASIPSLLKES